MQINNNIPNRNIEPPKYDTVSEGFDPDDCGILRKESFTMTHVIEVIESSWMKFANWIKKSIAMMIIFVLIGMAGGIYIAKIAYDMRMDEV